MSSCVSYSIDVCTVAIKNIGNMHAVSINQIADIFHVNIKYAYISLFSKYHPKLASALKEKYQIVCMKNWKIRFL